MNAFRFRMLFGLRRIFFPLILVLPLSSQAATGVKIIKSNGDAISSERVLSRFAFARMNTAASPPLYGLSDDGRYSRKTWDTAVYGAQGSLIARKLLAFGGADEQKFVRDMLLAMPIDEDGFVDENLQGRGHLTNDYDIESNLEAVLIAKSYLQHTGDAALFTAARARVTCYTNRHGQQIALHRAFWQSYDCTSPPAEVVPQRTYVERMHKQVAGARVAMNPGRSLGQQVRIYEPFKSLKIALVRPWAEVWPYRVVIIDKDRRRTIYDRVFDQVPSSGWAEFSFSALQPSGNYEINLMVHGGLQIYDGNEGKFKQVHDSDSFWYSAGWITDVGSTTNGGALTRIYSTDDPLGAPALTWNVKEKVERALNWSLRRALRPNGTFGLFITPFATARGTGERGVGSSNYYDLYKFGFKDSYVNALYIRALEAYRFLEGANLARTQVSEQMLADTRNEYANQFVSATGHVMTWIGCSSVVGDRSACSPYTTQDGWQHPYDLDFLPSQALASTLSLPNSDRVKEDFARLRNATRTAAVEQSVGLFRTNRIAAELVSPDIWTHSEEWTLRDANGWAVYDPLQQGDWHFFHSGTGYGNFGNQEENGGVLMSTSAWVFEAGPYPEMYADFNGLIRGLDDIADQIESGNTGQLSGGLVRRPVTDPLVKEFCLRLRAHAPAMCDYYKSISLSLPENGSFVDAFVRGLLQLQIGPTGALSLWGVMIRDDGSLFELPGAQGKLPQEVDKVQVRGYRVYGKTLDIDCDYAAAQLSCSARQSGVDH